MSSWFVLPQVVHDSSLSIVPSEVVHRYDLYPCTSYSAMMYYAQLMHILHRDAESPSPLSSFAYEYLYRAPPSYLHPVSATATHGPSYFEWVEVVSTCADQLPISPSSLLVHASTPTDVLSALKHRQVLSPWTRVLSVHSLERLYSSRDKLDALVLETSQGSVAEHMESVLHVIMMIAKFQCAGPHTMALIKLGGMVHKPVLDCLYLLSMMYEQVSVGKPSVSHPATFDRFVVCRGFRSPESWNRVLFLQLYVFWKKRMTPTTILHSILPMDLPYRFMCEINNINVAFSHTQLDTLHHLITSSKKTASRQEEAKVDKCVSWCEKYGVALSPPFARPRFCFARVVDEVQLANAGIVSPPPL